MWLQEPAQGPTLSSHDPNVNDDRGVLTPVTSGVPGSAKDVEPCGELELSCFAQEEHTVISYFWIRNDAFIERIYPNYFWQTNLTIATIFFQKAILPEILGKFFSRPKPKHLLQ